MVKTLQGKLGELAGGHGRGFIQQRSTPVKTGDVDVAAVGPLEFRQLDRLGLGSATIKTADEMKNIQC